MEKVELRLAYEWTCDSCGRDNFLRSIRCDESRFTADELSELRQEHGVEPEDVGEFCLRPSTVTCRFCDAEFET